MCLIAWNWQPGTAVPLLLLANRDEFYARPSEPLHWWPGGQLLAGRDLSGGGTWLGLSQDGRMAALTNYRYPSSFRADAPSRGALVVNFLQEKLTAAQYLAKVAPTLPNFNPFNLLLFDGLQLMGLESRHARQLVMAPGNGAVSNADFLTPWPKVEKLRLGLAQLNDLAQTGGDEALWQLLLDKEVAPDKDLPRTGIPLERERALSSAFITSPDYGTRACTLLRIGRAGFFMEERLFDAGGPLGSAQFRA